MIATSACYSIFNALFSIYYGRHLSVFPHFKFEKFRFLANHFYHFFATNGFIVTNELPWRGLLAERRLTEFSDFGARSRLADVAVLVRNFAQIQRERGLKRAGNVLARSLFRLGYVARWHRWIDGLFQAQCGIPAPVSIHIKPLRRYLCRGLPLRARLTLLTEHYALAFERMDRRLLRQVLTTGEAEVGRVAGRDRTFGVQLRTSSAAACHREGEFSIALTDETAAVTLARMTFVLAQGVDGRPIVVVGGIQGHMRRDMARLAAAGGVDMKQMVVAATRSLGGVRPKDAVLLVLTAMAAEAGIGEVLGVSNACHVTTTWRGESTISADYDSYWRDRGAEPHSNVGFRLAVDPADLTVETAGNRREAAKAALRQVGRRLANPDAAGTPPAGP